MRQDTVNQEIYFEHPDYQRLTSPGSSGHIITTELESSESSAARQRDYGGWNSLRKIHEQRTAQFIGFLKIYQNPIVAESTDELNIPDIFLCEAKVKTWNRRDNFLNIIKNSRRFNDIEHKEPLNPNGLLSEQTPTYSAEGLGNSVRLLDNTTAKLINEIDTLSRLHHDWDGEGAPPPSCLAASSARVICEKLPSDIKITAIRADVIGGIVLWVNIQNASSNDADKRARFAIRNSGRTMLVCHVHRPGGILSVEDVTDVELAAKTIRDFFSLSGT